MVIQCESAEAAELVLQHNGGALCLLLTDVNLAGTMTGDELARIAHERFPKLNIVVTSGKMKPQLHEGMTFLPKPRRAADLIREAEKSCHA